MSAVPRGAGQGGPPSPARRSLGQHRTSQRLGLGARKREAPDIFLGKKKKKSNRQTGGPSCLFQVLCRRGLTPGRPTHWKGQPHPQAPRRPRGGARPHHALLREKREAGPGPRRCAGGRGGRETAGRAAGRASGAAQSSASLEGGQGCELVPGGHAHQPKLGSWGSQGTCMERMCWRGPGTAFLSVGDLRGRAASGSTPSIGPQPESPVPGLQRPVRVFSPLGREGGWWPRRRLVPLFLTPCRLRGSPGSRNAVAAVQITPRARAGEPQTPVYM